MKAEHSAGGVVVRRTKKGWEVLLLCDMSGNWTFPKGLIEVKEASYETARREIQEEVGVTDLTLLTELSPIHYCYRRNGLIKKTVHYYLFSSRGKEPLVVQKEEGVQQASWFDLSRAIEQIGYRDTNTPLLVEARAFLSAYGGRKST